MPNKGFFHHELEETSQVPRPPITTSLVPNKMQHNHFVTNDITDYTLTAQPNELMMTSTFSNVYQPHYNDGYDPITVDVPQRITTTAYDRFASTGQMQQQTKYNFYSRLDIATTTSTTSTDNTPEQTFLTFDFTDSLNDVKHVRP